jgi:hypothetical protein
MSMNIRTLCRAFIFGAAMLMTATPASAQPQSNSVGAAGSNDVDASATKRATPTIRPNRTKHRYWRHRGGRHPHFGSRRVQK